MNIKDLFYTIILVFIFLLMVNIFGILSINKSFIPSFLFSSVQIEKLLSVFVSCLSILLTGFFAVLAIDAYGKIRDIKREAEDAKKYRDSAYSSLLDLGKAQILFYENVIKNIEAISRINNKDEKTQKSNKKWREHTYVDLYRLGLNPSLLSKEKRMEFIRNLSSFAEIKDIEELEEICNSSTEPEELKRIAREVLDLNNEQKSSDVIEEKPSFCHRIKMAWDIIRNTE